MADSWNKKQMDSRQQQVLDALDSVVSGNPVNQDLAKDELVQIAAAIRESQPQPTEKFSRRIEKTINRGMADSRSRRRGFKLGLGEWFDGIGTQRLALAGAACFALLVTASALALLRPAGEGDSQNRQASVKKNSSSKSAAVAQHGRVTKSKRQREKPKLKRQGQSQEEVAQNSNANGSPGGQSGGKIQPNLKGGSKKQPKPKGDGKDDKKPPTLVATPVPIPVGKSRGPLNTPPPAAAPTDPESPGPQQPNHEPSSNKP